MTDRPLVSVVTIFLNAERFLREAVDSVFLQTYENWELLLVDDGSTDGSTEIARQYARDFPGKVRRLEHDRHQNRGMSASRNLALTHARGEYVALLDADDVWFPHKIEQQTAIMASQPRAAMVYGRSQYWRSWNGSPEDSQRDSLSELGLEPNALIEPPELLTLWFLRKKGTTPCTCSVLFQRAAAIRIGGFEDAFTGLFEDLAFFVKMCLEEPVFVADACWDRRREHPDSCVWVAGLDPARWHASRLFFLNWFEQYLESRRSQEGDVWRAVQDALWPYRHPTLVQLSRVPQRLVRRALAYLGRTK